MKTVLNSNAQVMTWSFNENGPLIPSSLFPFMGLSRQYRTKNSVAHIAKTVMTTRVRGCKPPHDDDYHSLQSLNVLVWNAIPASMMCAPFDPNVSGFVLVGMDGPVLTILGSLSISAAALPPPIACSAKEITSYKAQTY